MAGIFDIMNHPGTGENDITLPQSFFDGLFLMSVAGIRTSAQLRTLIEDKMGRTLLQAEIDDLTAVIAYVQAGTGEAGKIARLHRFTSVSGIWETGQGNITEAEARMMMGAFV